MMLASLPVLVFLAVIVSSSSPNPFPSSAIMTSGNCSRHADGDANCDGVIDIADFEQFRKEYTGIDTSKSTDFDGDTAITIQDFELWRRGYFGESTATATVTPPVTGKIYYVSTSGNDSASGTKSAPFKSISKAVAIATSGDEIHILPGTYSQRISVQGKNGKVGAPIVIVGDATDPAQYPVIDGGDASSNTAADWASSTPAVTVTGSSWIVFERLRIINSSPSSISLDSSNYIVVRRMIMDYHKYAVLNRNGSNHILMEHNDIYQSYGDKPWSAIKSSKWEGGAYTSFGGGSVVTIRHNYIHDSFNGIYIFRNTRTGPYMDANVWIYRNRFENILDDPYEPDVSYAFNNHFFENTLINTHRLASMASGSGTLPDRNLGPVYIYDNVQLTTYDITKEASSRGSYNSAWKVELNVNWYEDGIYMFNNSIDLSQVDNGVGLHILNGNGAVNNWHHLNNAYRTKGNTYTTAPVLHNSTSDYNISSNAIKGTEVHSIVNTDPGFTDPIHELFTLKQDAPARGKAREVVLTVGFESSVVVPAGSDIGAFQFGENDFRKTPAPKYVIPPGGENAKFGTNEPWPEDTRKGVNPPSGFASR